jgi:hypothetical protein
MNLKSIKNGTVLLAAAVLLILTGCPGTGTETKNDEPGKIIITFDLSGAEGTPPGPLTLTVDP